MSVMNFLYDGITLQYRNGFHSRGGIDWEEWKTGSFYIQKNARGDVVVLAARRSRAETGLYPDGYTEYDPRRDIVEIQDDVITLDCEEYGIQIKLPLKQLDSKTRFPD